MRSGKLSPTYTVSGASVAALLAYARARGADLSGAVAVVGLAGVDLAQPETRVEAAANDDLWERAVSATGDPDFGLHFAQRLDIDGFHLVGHIALSSRTVGEAIARVVAFSRLLHDAGRTEAERATDGGLLLFPGCRGLPQQPSRHVAEFSTASVVLLVRLITALPAWSPLEVAFHHAAPASLRAHREILGVTPTFDATETRLLFDARSLELPVRTTAPSQVGRYLESFARSLLEKLPEQPDDLRGQVFRAIVTGLPEGRVSVDAVATRLGMTGRTLQRRLAAEGAGFAALVDEARRGYAERYLGDGRLPLAEISYLLGFDDPSTFHKAFRRWTGTTPGEFRASALGR